MRSLRLLISAALLLGIVGCAGGGGGAATSTVVSTVTSATSTTSADTGTATATTSPSPTVLPTDPTATATTSSGGGQVPVRVYFAREEKVATAGRTVSGPEVAAGAMIALLAGPDEFETGIGMTSAIPAGTDLLGIDVDGTEARVDLSGEFATGGGSLSMQLRVAQVVFTLTQFDTITTVSILLDGVEPTKGIGGEGVPATDLDRVDVEGVVPFVLVESPVPGQAVSSPVTIAGYSNTYEATVLYTVTDPEGLIIADGFTMATSGTGTWGTFSISVPFTSARSGLGAVMAAGEDARDGGQQDVYEVPVRMG